MLFALCDHMLSLAVKMGWEKNTVGVGGTYSFHGFAT